MGGRKYSTLSQINRGNVANLEVAWSARVGDFPPKAFDSRGHGMQVRFEVTPLMRDGFLYVSTPTNRVLGFDPATGATRWTFDPEIDRGRSYGEDLTSRGVAVWVDDDAPALGRCSNRIFLATIEGRVYALDAADGIPCDGFGSHGVVDLRAGVEPNGDILKHDDSP